MKKACRILALMCLLALCGIALCAGDRGSATSRKSTRGVSLSSHPEQSFKGAFLRDSHDDEDHHEEENAHDDHDHAEDAHDDHDHADDHDEHDHEGHSHDDHDHDGHDDHDDHDDHAHENDETSGLRGSKLWSFSILGGLVSAFMSVLAALGASTVSHDFSNKHTGRAYLNSFSSGIMLGLVFVHLVPEGQILAGGSAHDYKFPLAFLVGFFAGVAVQHASAILGHRYSASSSDSSSELVQGSVALEAANASLGAHPLQNITESSNQSQDPNTPLSIFPIESVVPADLHKVRGLTLIQWSLISNIFAGDFLCNFVDGIVTAAAFWECGTFKGFMVSLAICLHELPQEISDFLILRRSGFSLLQSLAANASCSLATLLGVLAFMAIVASSDQHSIHVVGYILASGAGFLTFAAVGLLRAVAQVTEVRHAAGCWALLLLGPLIMFLVLLWHPECGHEGHDH